MKFLKNVKWFVVAVVVMLATAEACLAQSGNANTSGGPVSGSDEQTSAIDLIGKQGQHEVDLFTGSFQYSIPIACAPARNSSQPNLVLGYSSSGDLGWCGMGWTLDIGSISRNVRDGFPIAYSSGSPQAPLNQYDDTKGFMLNLFGKGYKLFSVNTNGTIVEYRAEVDTDFLRCFLDTVNDFWTIYDKSGTAYYFGETSSTRVSNPRWTGTGSSITFHWALDQIVTASGDWTTISYTNSTSPYTGLPERELYPFQIAYNGHTNYNGYTANYPPPDTITFQTQLRTNDWRFSFPSGFRTDQTRRLTNILCQIGTQPVWSYTLQYGISPATGRSLLTNVVTYGYTGSTPTPFLTNSFAYQANPNGVSFSAPIIWTNLDINTPGTTSGSYEPEVSQVNQETGANVPYEYTIGDLVDIDGDGLPDRVLWNGTNAYQVQKNLGIQANGNGLFGSPYTFGPTSTGPGTIATNSNPFPNGTGYTELNDPYGRLIDIDGDGLPDRVMDYWWAMNSAFSAENPPYVPYTNYEVQLNLGNGFSSVSNWPVNTGPLLNTNENSLYYYCVEDGGVNVGFFDINGDGRPDRVMSGWWQQAPMTNFLVQLNTGTNFGPVVNFGPYYSQNYNAANTTEVYNWAGVQTPDAYMIDINGDGLPDRVMWPLDPNESNLELPHPSSYWAVEYNDGYRFESTNTSTSIPGAFDQWPGVVAQTNNGTQYYDGVQYWSDSINDEPYGGLFDVNGDGLPDRVMVDVGSINQPISAWRVYLNNGHGFNTNAIILTNIDNEGQYNIGAGALAWWSPQEFYGSYGNLTTMIDINGDGLLDRVLAVYYSSTPSSNYFIVQLNQGPYPDLLTNVNNGIGGNVAITYNPSTAYDNRTDPTSATSGSHMPFPKYVTATVTESDGVNPPQMTTYGYGGGYYDGPRREFHGFAVVTNTDPTLRSTVTYFHTGGGRNYAALGEYQDTNSTTGLGNFAKAGMPYRVETYGNDGELYHVTINQVNQDSLGNARYFPFTDLTIDCDYPGNGTPNMTATQFAYDQNTGNLTNKIEYGQINNSSFNPTNVGSFTFTDTTASDDRYYNTTYAAISGNSYIVNDPATDILADGSGNIIQQTDYSYNPSSGTIAAKLTQISPGYFATNSYANYTAYGMVGFTTDPEGVQTVITYDSTYNTYPATTRLEAIPGTESANDFITTTTYDARSGELEVSTDPSGLTTSNSFDSFCRPTETDRIPIGGGSPIWVKKITYPTALQPIASGLATNYVDDLDNDGVGGEETRTYVDGFGRPIQTRTLGESGNYRVVSTAYDGRGNVILTTWPTFGTSITFTKPTSGESANWIGYDALGRVATNCAVSVTFNSNGAFSSEITLEGETDSPLGAKTWSYVNGTDPWWIIYTDEDGQIRRYHLDALGRTNLILEVDGSNIYTNQLNYDLADNLTNIINAKGENFYWAYNNEGDVVAIADPYLGQWTYQRDYAGRLRVQTDARLDVISNSYVNPTTGYQDAMGRLQVQTVFSFNYSNQTFIPAYTNTYFYDSSSDGSNTVYPGLLYEVVDKQGYEKSGYDTLTRTITSTRFLNINTNSYTTTKGYDQGDNVTSIGYPNGPTINYSYFHGKSIEQVSLGGGSYDYYTVPAAAYDAFGHVTNFTYQSGLTTTRTFYPISQRLESISAGASGSVFSRTYQYTAGNDITSIGLGSSGTMSISYYNLHRIKSYTGNNGLSGSYGYDPTGNITNNIENGGSAYTYANPRVEAVRTAYGYTNLYDLCGNMIVRHDGLTNAQALVYDPENRLSAISQAGVFSDEFGYAYDGTRLWKRIDQNPTNIQVWIGNIYEQKDGLTLFHVFAGTEQICTFVAGSPLDGGTNTSAVGYYYHEDTLNTSSVLSSSTGSQVEVDVYYPFGSIQTDSPQAPFQVSRRFTGQVFDAESGLYYYNARYYDPELGRFIQPDTSIPDISNPQTYNRYSYCLNDPLRFNDPNGQAPVDWANAMQPGIDEYYGGYISDTSHTSTLGLWLAYMGESVDDSYNDMLRLGTGAAQGGVDGWSADLGRAGGIILTVTAVSPKAIPADVPASEAPASAPEASTSSASGDTASGSGNAPSGSADASSGGGDSASDGEQGGAIPKTEANQTKGWKPGDPINNLTPSGNVPSWNTVRSRFWKNEALNNPGEYTPEDLARMRRGLPPQRINPKTGKPESKELHHIPPQRSGGKFDVIPVWPDEHAAIDPYRQTGN